MKNFVNRSVRLNDKEEMTLRRAVKRAVKSIFERENSPMKRRILLDTIPLQVYGEVAFALLMEEFRLLEEEKKKKPKKKAKKVRKSSSKS
jgi:hypothetical protein